MATSTDLTSPARSAGDTQEPEEHTEEVYHDSNTNWQKIQEVKERLRKLEAFDQEIQGMEFLGDHSCSYRV